MANYSLREQMSGRVSHIHIPGSTSCRGRAVLVVYLVANEYLALGTQVMIMIIFAPCALKVVLGYGGIPTLGHAALFGAGACPAGLFAMR